MNCFADFNISAGEQTKEEDEEEEMLRKAIRLSVETFGKIMLNISDISL